MINAIYIVLVFIGLILVYIGLRRKARIKIKSGCVVIDKYDRHWYYKGKVDSGYLFEYYNKQITVLNKKKLKIFTNCKFR